MDNCSIWLMVCGLVVTIQCIADVKADKEEPDDIEKRRMVMFGKREDKQDVEADDKRAFGWGSYQWPGQPSSNADANLAMDIDTKRAFGTILSAGRPRRKFLFGKRKYEEPLPISIEEGEESDNPNKRRTFSFGRRSDGSADEGLDALENLDKRRVFALGRRSDDSSLVGDAIGDNFDYPEKRRSFSFGRRSDASSLTGGYPLDEGYDDVWEDKRGRIVLLGKRPFGGGSFRWGSSGSANDDDSSLLMQEKRPFGPLMSAHKRLFKFGKRDHEI